MRILPLTFIFFLAACTAVQEANVPLRTLIQLAGPEDEVIELEVEIADDVEERRVGLMFREELQNGNGMLFIFEQPQPLSFWMKNTRIPLDVLFFAADGSFVSRTTMEPCRADPCPTYQSSTLAQYALEVPAGDPHVSHVEGGWVLLSE